jgi:hypothetical protein
VANPEKVLFSQVPIAPMPAIAATEIKIAIRAYSIAVAPDPSRHSPENSARIPATMLRIGFRAMRARFGFDSAHSS